MIHLKVTNKIKFAFQVLEDKNTSTIDFRSTIKNYLLNCMVIDLKCCYGLVILKKTKLFLVENS